MPRAADDNWLVRGNRDTVIDFSDGATWDRARQVADEACDAALGVSGKPVQPEPCPPLRIAMDVASFSAGDVVQLLPDRRALVLEVGPETTGRGKVVVGVALRGAGDGPLRDPDRGDKGPPIWYDRPLRRAPVDDRTRRAQAARDAIEEANEPGQRAAFSVVWARNLNRQRVDGLDDGEVLKALVRLGLGDWVLDFLPEAPERRERLYLLALLAEVARGGTPFLGSPTFCLSCALPVAVQRHPSLQLCPACLKRDSVRVLTVGAGRVTIQGPFRDWLLDPTALGGKAVPREETHAWRIAKEYQSRLGSVPDQHGDPVVVHGIDPILAQIARDEREVIWGTADLPPNLHNLHKRTISAANPAPTVRQPQADDWMGGRVARRRTVGQYPEVRDPWWVRAVNWLGRPIGSRSGPGEWRWLVRTGVDGAICGYCGQAIEDLRAGIEVEEHTAGTMRLRYRHYRCAEKQWPRTFRPLNMSPEDASECEDEWFPFTETAETEATEEVPDVPTE